MKLLKFSLTVFLLIIFLLQIRKTDIGKQIAVWVLDWNDKTILSTLYGASERITVDNREELVEVLYTALVAREQKVSVYFSGKGDSIFEGDLEELMSQVAAIDRETSDDFDYLKGTLKKYNISYNSIGAEFIFEYLESAEELAIVNEKAAQILKKEKILNMPPYQKVKTIHDYIIRNVTYDQSLQKYTAYEALQSKRAVCQGYTLLGYKLLTEAGIPCRYITGKTNTPHAWNLVQLDGKWYNMDITWDDPVGDTDVLSYQFFLLGKKNFEQDHISDPEFTTNRFYKTYPVSRKDFRIQPLRRDKIYD